MVARLITSLQHPLAKKLVKLRENRSFRAEEKTVLIVGRTVIQEVARVCKIKTLVSTHPLPFPAETTEYTTETVLQKIIGHKADDLVVAEVHMPSRTDLTKCACVVALDGISDPGNVGTIFRTAWALGWEGILVIQGSADPYNDKALRASRGISLLLPWCEGSWQDAQCLIHAAKRDVVIADTQGVPLSQKKFTRPLLLVLGHETKGPSPSARSLGNPITIPMQNGAQSLNVASAASILLYHIRQVLHD